MSSSYSANQFDDAFKSQRLQNWGVTSRFKERPTARKGHTICIANDRGHLLPRVKRGTAWSTFQGTWDMPARIPSHAINPTGRSKEGLERLQAWGFDPLHTGTCRPQRGSRNLDVQQETEDLLQDETPTHAVSPEPPASADQRTAILSQASFSFPPAGDDQAARDPTTGTSSNSSACLAGPVHPATSSFSKTRDKSPLLN